MVVEGTVKREVFLLASELREQFKVRLVGDLCLGESTLYTGCTICMRLQCRNAEWKCGELRVICAMFKKKNSSVHSAWQV